MSRVCNDFFFKKYSSHMFINISSEFTNYRFLRAIPN
ncbi:Hypothetical protein OINT_2001717 [Brucella intermedia LMG 3301]|uniref:Uncharacterized protein n=1 Tax=Brucella intermedia LMG 3301 TaxID=641118 RepID=C4WQE7_9HYPH|nr:Hypothetical protein OINT_2001717 [Brucella intermedia LMG 3301]